MLSATLSQSPDHAKGYFSTADYLADGQELPLRWGGDLARRFALRGRVEKAHFERLCDNLHPIAEDDNGEPLRLTLRTRDNRSPGMDFTFDWPKAASVLRERVPDELRAAMEEAFDRSVRETMREIQAEAETRVRKNGQDLNRRTANLLWIEADHFTARPVGGFPDQHRHRHVFVLNATWDPVEQAYKAVNFQNLKASAPRFEARFHARFAGRLANLGFEIERHGSNYFTITGVPRSVSDKTSRRTDVIDRKARELEEEIRRTHPGAKLSAAGKAALATTTREAKARHLTMTELGEIWESRYTDSERAALNAVAARASVSEQGRRTVGAQADRLSVEHSLDHWTERVAAVPEHMVLTEALRHGVGKVTVEGVEAALARADVIRATIDGTPYVTTRAALVEERAMIAFAREGRAACRRLGPHDWAFDRGRVDEGQEAAARHVLASGDRVMMLTGKAGTGKTRTLREIAAALEIGEAVRAAGGGLVPLAPSVEAVGVLREEGFADAETLQRFLLDARMQEAARGQVLMVDEAGLVGTRNMKRLFDLAGALDARVLLVGDAGQHAPVERGEPLKDLVEYAGLKPAEIRNIRRQTGEYREAARALADGAIEAGYQRLDAMGWVRELPGAERHARLAADYLAATERPAKAPKTWKEPTTLVVAPTHAEGRAVTTAIREQLKEAGRLKEGREVLQLVPANLTEAQRRDPHSYAGGGMVLQFHRHAKGFRAGDRIDAAAPGTVPLDQAAKFQAYHADSLPLAVGDKVRFTANGTTADGRHRLVNGSVHTVAGFTEDGGIRLANNWVVPRDFGHVAHGYALTSHAVQSKTVDHVFISLGPEALPAVNRRELYVDISRGRRQATIHTEDKEALRARVGKDTPRVSATEVARRRARRDEAERRVAFLVRLARLRPPALPQPPGKPPVRPSEPQREVVHER